jgi:outer membrane protein OmpA-like peptidoglycan-associated protein
MLTITIPNFIITGSIIFLSVFASLISSIKTTINTNAYMVCNTEINIRNHCTNLERQSLAIKFNYFPTSTKLNESLGDLADEEQFIIYFTLNSDRLSPLGREEIKRAAQMILNEGAKQVLVVGHADQVGTPVYNLRLSRRRSKTVLQRLRQENISPAILNADWKGEFDPSVPVGENDIEPLNRRVVIHVIR